MKNKLNEIVFIIKCGKYPTYFCNKILSFMNPRSENLKNKTCKHKIEAHELVCSCCAFEQFVVSLAAECHQKEQWLTLVRMEYSATA